MTYNSTFRILSRNKTQIASTRFLFNIPPTFTIFRSNYNFLRDIISDHSRRENVLG